MTKKNTLIALALILAAVISFVVIAPWASNPEEHQDTIHSVDQKIETVMKLTAGSTAASALISAMPGDTATPIADELADYSTYFMIVLCALYLEKYLITVTGFAAFKILFPAAAIMLIIGMFRHPEFWNHLGKKIAIFGVAVFLLVPLSVRVSDMIYNTYATSIDATIASANQEDLIPVDEETGGVASWFIDRTTNLTNTATGILSRFVEALAVMIVTSCLIPILVLIFLYGMVKMILGVDISNRIPGWALNGKFLSKGSIPVE